MGIKVIMAFNVDNFLGVSKQSKGAKAFIVLRYFKPFLGNESNFCQENWAQKGHLVPIVVPFVCIKWSGIEVYTPLLASGIYFTYNMFWSQKHVTAGISLLLHGGSITDNLIFSDVYDHLK